MKKTWINGQTMGAFRTRRGRKYETYYFVDDRKGGRRAASPLEAALWRRAVGPIPSGLEPAWSGKGSPKRSDAR